MKLLRRIAWAAIAFWVVAIVVLILLVTYRSPVLWLLPLLCVGVALTVAQALIYVLAAHAGLTVNSDTEFLLTVLVFGAGTDYALLLTARYREELRRAEDRYAAMATAIRRAGPAIAASAVTVAVSPAQDQQGRIQGDEHREADQHAGRHHRAQALGRVQVGDDQAQLVS
ncbi:Putative membrane protein ActII-3 [Nocardia seriolae]|uniref:Membrane protein ActII-3 n=1 Tax=Nocardia seriolae TaxID=37332 RepID=A0ABC9YQD8_9NOCA|nr:MMPL family transporter [Nocardia seriolae]APA96892.1 Putative membrane protein ActII-3 [Nocardia seriolae]OJF81996.1 hypothetical protein NS14008_26035 [Nocardia seriolae]WKY54277.1 MMPL family transporter [Nocardia seriolae]WNJ61123.1 MMPL family transporter [Nocardia seriolae]BAW08910.1 conserved hypothetical protein [Nocardia seriolae]